MSSTPTKGGATARGGAKKKKAAKALANAKYYDKNRAKINENNKVSSRKRKLTPEETTKLKRRKRMEGKKRRAKAKRQTQKEEQQATSIEYKAKRPQRKSNTPPRQPSSTTTPTTNEHTFVLKAGEHFIPKNVLLDLGGFFRSTRMKSIPSKRKIFEATKAAFTHFRLAPGYHPPNTTLRLRGGAAGGAAGASCDARAGAASVGTSVMAGGATKRIKKTNHHHSKSTNSTKQKKKKTTSSVSQYSNIPFPMECLKKKPVRDLIRKGSTLYHVAKAADAEVKKVNRPMHNWIMNTIDQQYRPFEGLCFTGMSVVGDLSIGSHNRPHKDKGESTVGATVTFGDDNMEGGATVFWAKKDKVNQPVRLLMQQQNGRITVGRWDLVTHAGTKWTKPRTVYTFYIKTNILTFFEKYKGNKNNQRHSHIYHKFTARTQKEHVDFTRLKPSSISI